MSTALDNSEIRLLTRPEAAAWLRARYHVGSKSWLAALSVKGQGPAFAIVGKQSLYHPDDLAQWINERYLSAKGSKRSSAPSVPAAISRDPLAVDPSIEEPKVPDYFSGADAETIALGLKIAAELAA